MTNEISYKYVPQPDYAELTTKHFRTGPHAIDCNCLECSPDSFEAGDYLQNVKYVGLVSADGKTTTVVKPGAIGKVASVTDTIITFTNGQFVWNDPTYFKVVSNPNWTNAIDLLIVSNPLSYIVAADTSVLTGTPTGPVQAVKQTAQVIQDTGAATLSFVSGNWKFILIGIIVIIVGLAVLKLT